MSQTWDQVVSSINYYEQQIVDYQSQYRKASDTGRTAINTLVVTFKASIETLEHELQSIDPLRYKEYKQEAERRRAAIFIDTSRGCYVATCVYGTYDCPEVWVLRRYRDETLSRSCAGKKFIRLYYLVSPHFVKLFGKTRWVRNTWKLCIDRLVNSLKESGIDDSPYSDV